MITYFYINKDLTAMNMDTAALLVAFVRFILGAEGQAMAVDNLFSPLPDAIIAYNNNTLNSLMLPAGTPTYSTELASNTLIEVGAGPYVISGKRRSYAEYYRTVTAANVAANASEHITTLSAQMDAVTASDDDRDGDTRTIALTGLALGAIGMFFGILSFTIVMTRGGNVGKPVQREVSFPKVEHSQV